MATWTTSDLSRKSGDIIAEALRHPVTITQRKKPRLVVMSYEQYERIRKRGDLRRTGTLENMPDDLFEAFKKGVEEYERKSKSR